MADKVRVWYDREGDFLEVTFAERPGYMRETRHDAVIERVDDDGGVDAAPARGFVRGIDVGAIFKRKAVHGDYAVDGGIYR